MTSRILSTAVCLAGSVILAVGCANPSGSSRVAAPTSIGQTVPTNSPSLTPTSAAVAASLPGSSTQSSQAMTPVATNAIASTPSSTAASGYISDNVVAPSTQAVTQVSYTVPGQGVSATPCGCGIKGQCPPHGGLGCNGLGGCQKCQVAPYGYAMPCPCGCNAYGIDPQEFICDGGDNPPNATVRRDDSIGGLQPEDTIVHYTTEAGDIEIKASNKVCLYAPRFLAVRKITGARAGGRAIGAAQFDRPVGAGRFDQPLPGLVMTDTTELAHADVARRIDAMRERIRGVPVEAILQPEQATDVMAALVGLTIDELNELKDEERALLEQFAQAAIIWALDEAVEVVIEDLKPPTLTRDESLQGLTIYEFPDAGRLQICKLADRTDALPGEYVNFAIRVENVGDSAVDHVVLTDNLTTRLEYVEGSQTCSGGAEFQSYVNDGQSLRLEWKLTDKLRVGESVTIRFKCKVR